MVKFCLGRFWALILEDIVPFFEALIPRRAEDVEKVTDNLKARIQSFFGSKTVAQK